jgi:hypothetical protein
MALVGALLVLAQTPVCVPGTAVCAVSDGRGGVRVDASGNAQAGPGGASATGRANAEANAAANANSAGQASGQADGGAYYRESHGRSGSGVTLCPSARVGVWSGFKAGGCIAIGFRWEKAGFEMETQLLYGGVTHAFDWSFPMSLLVPLANHDSLFEGPYLRFGGSPVGATFARDRDGGSFVRFGLFAGGGYELNLADWVAWRVFDLRLSFDLGTKRAMDDRGHWFDPGLLLGTGLVL